MRGIRLLAVPGLALAFAGASTALSTLLTPLVPASLAASAPAAGPGQGLLCDPEGLALALDWLPAGWVSGLPAGTPAAPDGGAGPAERDRAKPEEVNGLTEHLAAADPRSPGPLRDAPAAARHAGRKCADEAAETGPGLERLVRALEALDPAWPDPWSLDPGLRTFRVAIGPRGQLIVLRDGHPVRDRAARARTLAEASEEIATLTALLQASGGDALAPAGLPQPGDDCPGCGRRAGRCPGGRKS